MKGIFKLLGIGLVLFIVFIIVSYNSKSPQEKLSFNAQSSVKAHLVSYVFDKDTYRSLKWSDVMDADQPYKYKIRHTFQTKNFNNQWIERQWVFFLDEKINVREYKENY